MRSRWTAIACAGAILVSACGDSSSPEVQGTIDMVLDFCAGDVPQFFAYQNTGGSWVRASVDGNGSFKFRTTEKFSVAAVWQAGADFSTEVINTTATEMAGANGAPCVESSGTKTVNGSFVNVPTGNGAEVAMGFAYNSLGSAGAFPLAGLPSGSVDLVAVRRTVASPSIPNKIIVRRAQNIASGATMTPLDFDATEALVPTAHSVAISGLVSGESNGVFESFQTGGGGTSIGTYIGFFSISNFSTSPQTFYAAPSTIAGDLHQLLVYATVAAPIAERGAIRFFRTGAAQTIALGAALSVPTISSVGTPQFPRLRVQMAGQPDYNTLAQARFFQSSSSSFKEWIVYVTSGFAGTAGVAPTTWDVSIPDVSTAPGFPSAAFGSAQSTTVDVAALSARPGLFFGGPPNDGETYAYGFRRTATSTSVATAGDARMAGRRPMPLHRSR